MSLVGILAVLGCTTLTAACVGGFWALVESDRGNRSTKRSFVVMGLFVLSAFFISASIAVASVGDVKVLEVKR